MRPEATARKIKPVPSCERTNTTNINPINGSATSGIIKSTDRLVYFFLYRAILDHPTPAILNSLVLRDYKSLYAVFLFHISLLASAPAFEKAMVNIELVKHLAYHMVYQVIYSLRPVVKSWHSRQNDYAGTGKLGHVF